MRVACGVRSPGVQPGKKTRSGYSHTMFTRAAHDNGGGGRHNARLRPRECHNQTTNAVCTNFGKVMALNFHSNYEIFYVLIIHCADPAPLTAMHGPGAGFRA